MRPKKAPPANEEEAAVRIQGMWRARKARIILHDIARGTYEKLYDEESGECYYYNKATGESMWFKPLALGSDDVEMAPAVSELTEEQAAQMVQCSWRSRKARQLVFSAVMANWQTVREMDESGLECVYYCNVNTGETRWVKLCYWLMGDAEQPAYEASGYE